MVSLVLSAADTAAAMGSLHGLAALLGDVAGEVLLADDSADPGLALLPTLVRGIRVIGGDDGQACNLAVVAARAPVVMLLDAAPGRAAGMSLEASEAMRFIGQVRVFDDAEVAALALIGDPPHGSD